MHTKIYDNLRAQAEEDSNSRNNRDEYYSSPTFSYQCNARMTIKSVPTRLLLAPDQSVAIFTLIYELCTGTLSRHLERQSCFMARVKVERTMNMNKCSFNSRAGSGCCFNLESVSV